jgi:hypothetical protein
MPCYHLEIREHEEFGLNGIWYNSGRDYFQPATSGQQFAHDILEHPVKAHVNGYIDELMALGGVLAGRIYSGWHNKYRQINEEDLRSDIYSLASSALMSQEKLTPKSCNSYLQDSSMMQEIRSFVIKGLKEATNEYYEEEENPPKYDDVFDIDSIVGWICKGYQLFKKRFSDHDMYNLSVYLFNEIAEKSDNFLKGSELGQTAKLYVNFTTMEVRLEEDY